MTEVVAVLIWEGGEFIICQRPADLVILAMAKETAEKPANHRPILKGA